MIKELFQVIAAGFRRLTQHPRQKDGPQPLYTFSSENTSILYTLFEDNQVFLFDHVNEQFVCQADTLSEAIHDAMIVPGVFNTMLVENTQDALLHIIIDGKEVSVLPLDYNRER